MDERRAKGLSKFLSLLLRHRPEVLNLTLDDNGWVPVDDLMAGLRTQDRWSDVTLAEIEHVVATNNKKRFEFSEDGTRIRARQGHSVKADIDLGLQPVAPPTVLYHGTVAKYLGNIRHQGLRKMKRHHVHLSADRATATNVGGRRGKPVILLIHAHEMTRDGHEFYLSNNGVWLTEHVPSNYITFPE